MTYIDEMVKVLCPNGVEWKELGEVCEFIRGNGLQKKDLLEEGVPCIHYGQIYTYYDLSADKTKSFVSSELATKLRKASYGDVIVATTSENIEDVGKSLAWLGEEEVCIGGHSCILKTEQSAKYLVYYMRTADFQRQKAKMVIGTKVIELYPKNLARIKIPLPPLEIQEEIVKILDKFTEYVTELTTELTFRQKQYSYFRDKLLSFDDESMGGANDKVYTVQWKTLGEVCRKISSGGTPKSDNEEYYGGDIPWLRTQDIDFKDIVSTSATITQAGLENSSAKWVPINSIVIAMYGATAGKSAVTKISLTTNQACCNLEVDEELVNYRYVYHWVYKNYELLKAKGQGSQSNISGKIIKDFPIPLPSLAIQSRIVEVLDKFDTVCNDLNIGLPREIELRQKQYEFFRDKLLTFAAQGVYTDSTEKT